MPPFDDFDDVDSFAEGRHLEQGGAGNSSASAVNKHVGGGGNCDVDRAFDEILSLEDTYGGEGFAEGYEEGYQAGLPIGEEEGKEIGLMKGYEAGVEVGFYQGCSEVLQKMAGQVGNTRVAERLGKTAAALAKTATSFKPDVEDEQLTVSLDKMRGNHKLLASLLGSSNTSGQDALNF